MAKAVGLDIGAHHARLVEAEGSGKGVRVLRLGERDIAPPAEGIDRETAVAEAVDALFRDTRASRDEVVLAWPAEGCMIRELGVPFRETDQIRKVVKFEFESHLHSASIEDVVVDFVVTGDSREGARLLAIAAPKDPVRRTLRALEKVKVDPVAVDVDVASLAAAAQAAGAFEETPNCVLVDVGARSTKIVLVHEGRILTARAMRGGVDSLAAAVERDLGAEPGSGAARALEGGARPDDLMAVPAARPEEDAPLAERSAGSLETAVVEDRRSDFLARLCREVSRTLATAAPGTSFGAVHLTGRGALVPGVCGRMRERLGIEVRPLSLFSKVASPVPPESLEEADAVYASALGAAARALGVGPAQVDLRKEDLAFARRFDQVKGSLAVLLSLLLLAVGFLLWRAKTEKEVAFAEFNAMRSTLEATAQNVEAAFRRDLGEDQYNKLPKPSGEELTLVGDYQRRAKAMHNHLRNELGLSTEVPQIRSGLVVYRKVNEAIMSVRDRLEYCLVREQNYSQRDVKIQIVVSVAEHVDFLREAFDGIKDGDRKLFSEVGRSGLAQDKDGRWPVTFTLKIAEEPR